MRSSSGPGSCPGRCAGVGAWGSPPRVGHPALRCVARAVLRAHRAASAARLRPPRIDEETAVIGRDGGWQVHGAARVTVWRGRHRERPEPATPSESRRLHAASTARAFVVGSSNSLTHRANLVGANRPEAVGAVDRAVHAERGLKGPAPGCHRTSTPPRSTRGWGDHRRARSPAGRRCLGRRSRRRVAGWRGNSCSASVRWRTPSGRSTPGRRRSG